MTWTATPTSDPVNTGSGWLITAVLSDGVSEKFSANIVVAVLEDEAVKQVWRNEANKRSAANASAGKLSFVIGQPVDLTPPVPVVIEPTPEQKARSEFFIGIAKLDELQRWAARGLIGADDKRIADLQVVLRAQLLDSYIGTQ